MKTQHRMTWWSRHDPVMLPRGNTDNWAKMRTRVENQNPGYAGMMPGGSVDRHKSSQPGVTHPQGPNGDGRVSPRGHAVFSHLANRDLHGAVPGNYTLVQPTSQSSKSLFRNSFNERARSGFKYWYSERPNPTKFGKYGMGSYKTVLGLGNAPRT